jgi:hypothetical protein
MLRPERCGGFDAGGKTSGKEERSVDASEGLRIGPDGYFERGGRRCVPVGVNYWPGSCGVDLWTEWPEAEVRRDLDTVKALGLNCVRFFLRWQEFEPEAGRYDERSFTRLAQMLGWFRERDLLAQPSLFVGFMSGGTFWPAWKKDRNLFGDAGMVERSAAFARRAAAVIAPFHDSLAGIDYGNELDCAGESAPAGPTAVRRWCGAVSSAVRAEYPGALLVSGVSCGPLVWDAGWRYEDDLGTDFQVVHPYPVPYWQGLRFDGIRDPFAQAFLPYAVTAVRAFGPTMVQEFGTLITAAREPQDAYLRATLPAAWEAGANGFLWWCLRDIRSRARNYVKSCMEGTLGLVDDRDRVKPGLEYFLEFAKSLQDRPAPDRGVDLALYWPRHYWPKDDPGATGNDPRVVHNRLLSAYHLLRLAGRRVCVVRGGQPVPSSVRTILIAGAHPDGDEQAALDAWVAAGGRLVWHGPRWHEWGNDAARLLGARPADFRVQKAVRVEAFGRTWSFEHWMTPENARLELVPAGATPVAFDAERFPMVWRHDRGRGRVIFALPVVEEAVLAKLTDPPARDQWKDWYTGILQAAERANAHQSV